MSTILHRLRSRRANPANDDGHTGKPAAAPAAQAAIAMPRTRIGAWLSRPMTSFHLIVAITALLITMGLTMVLSASGVYSYDTDGSPWSVFAKQLLWTVIGLFAFYVALRTPVAIMRRFAFLGYGFTLSLIHISEPTRQVR